LKYYEDVSAGSIHPPEKTKEQKKRPPFRMALFLFLATCLTTIFAGYSLHVAFLYQGGEMAGRQLLEDLAGNPTLLLQGLPFSMALLLILLAHESGHYLACRFHGINCTLPYLIPAPPFVNMFGTFGALIRIKSPFLHRRQLFDVGIAGPIAGFVITIPTLVAGLLLSNETVVTPPETGYTLFFGEPLLFKGAAWLFFQGDPQQLNLHPLGWAAWIGMLATSLNLLPAGQLDGGHIVYSMTNPEIHKRLSAVTAGALILLGIWSWPVLAYLLFGILLLVMKLAHPPTLLDYYPLGRNRRILGILALIIFLLTFIPVPVQVAGAP